MNKKDICTVRIRPFCEDDKFCMAKLANNEKISINLRDGFPHPYTIKHAEDFIEMSLKFTPAQIFAIEYDGQYVGNISLIKGTDVYHKSAELGYFLGEPYWNKGIMTKAVNLICEYGFRELDVIRIYAGIFEYNTASQKVLEKCGFTMEAIGKKAICKNNQIYDEIKFVKLLE